MEIRGTKRFIPKGFELGTKWAISELLFVSVSKRVLVLNYCKGKEFDLQKNTQLISI